MPHSEYMCPHTRRRATKLNEITRKNRPFLFLLAVCASTTHTAHTQQQQQQQQQQHNCQAVN